MITAAITAGVGALLSLFGIKPGAYLVGVAIAVKVALVALGVVFGARVMHRRAAAKPVASALPDGESGPSGPTPSGPAR